MSEIITKGAFTGLKRNHYKVILADPPWLWESWSKKGESKSPSRHYDLMKFEDIYNMPFHEIMAEDCAVFVWCTWPTMPKPWIAMERWGVNYSGLAWEWFKFNPTTGKASFGGGLGGTRKNVEPCILARRGKPALKNRSERDWIIDESGLEIISPSSADILAAPRREHSRKPDETFARIERMFDGPYLELFARESRPGWESWGNEAAKFDKLRKSDPTDEELKQMYEELF